MAKKNSRPIYMQVAIDVAYRINKKEFKIGEKISGRSTLSSTYNVSPETIRKAMRLLIDMNIVIVKHGNGIYVNSIENAELFIERYKSRDNINILKEKLNELKNEKIKIDEKMNEYMSEIIDLSSRFKNTENITVYELPITGHMNKNAYTIETLKVWQNTGATIIGIKRDGKTTISPCPYEIIKENDVILFVGEPSCYIRMSDYLKKTDENLLL